ncbi:dienelactone hydrolase family protein [Nocardia amamiensis]|uniref:Dienelactone hydrolase family protein n=1 Tax=Nocardia amamiensis TaxID=404578 RepID=A0ABS0CNU6_9NOCA|nr:dienelactone hydrolase family protein [Nocardia amamiensis]MBF6298328.1 dienelactone hydrolase family protein [Nocardia amamiensis]
MSGTYDDIAPLRGSDQEDERRPTARGQVPITVVEPEGNARGGIVVLHESRQTTGALRDLMNALAVEGWTVVAPDLFHRLDGEPGAGVFGDELFDDFDACFDWLTRRGVFPDTIGVLGFDSAGTAAFLVATNRPIGAAVSVAARGIVEPLTEQADALVRAAPKLQAPWLGLFGEDDPATPPADVEQLRDATARADVASLVVTYPGLHHRADSPGDDDTDAADSQTRIFDWFDSNLR